MNNSSVAEQEKKIDALLAQMTLEEKVWLCHGCSGMEAGDIPRLNIPRAAMADGPQGVRLEDGRTTTAMPCGIALACTWSEATAEEYGALLGREILGTGNHVSLGPGLNMMRTPLNGRNFEYFGEDPVLSGKIAAGYIRGCQGEGAAATPKHLALNNQEICRTTGSSNIDERSLREVYLTAFEILVKESEPWMMMSAYNKVNGVYASACKQLQQEIVKDEWGFDGVMVSDWGGAHDTKGCALGGLDLEMGQGPTNSVMGKPLLELVEKGEVPEAAVDDKVRRVLRLFYRLGLLDGSSENRKGECNTQRHHDLVRKFAAEGMVLLKNDKNTLPLDAKKIKKIAVIGPNADFQHSMGALEVCGGSGAVHPDYDIAPLAGLKRYCEAKGIEVLYTPGEVFACNAIIPQNMLRHGGETGLAAEYFHTAEEMQSNAKPFLTLMDKNMQFTWNKVHAVAGNKADLPDRDFAVRWSGTFTPVRDGEAELLAYCIHGYVRIAVDGKDVIVTEKNMRNREAGWKFNAEAGRVYGVSIEFICTDPVPEFKLLWKQDAPDSRAEAQKLAAQADVVVFCGGTNHLYDKEGIGWGDVPGADIPDLKLPGRQDELINELAAVNPNIVVALTNGSVVDVERWIDRVPALLETWYAGMEGGNALAEVLFGEANPGGKLCCTWGKKLNDYACHANGNYPGVRTGNCPHVNYDEGMFIGYRHFERTGIAPRFPFGFGLDYSSIQATVTGVKVVDDSRRTPEVVVEVKVTNTGKRAGSQVVQVYVGDDEVSVPRPRKELKAFKKEYLESGESCTIAFTLGQRAFAFWTPSLRDWMVEPGDFTISIGTSSADIVHTAKVTLK